MSARKRHRRVIASDSDSEQDWRADGAPATAPRRLGRLRRQADDAGAVMDLCDDSAPDCAARAAAPPLVTPQLAAKPEAPATLRRSGLRERVPSSKQTPRMAALERLQRLRSGGGGALDDSEEEVEGDGSLSSGSGGSGAEEEQGEEEGSDAEEQPSSGIDDFIVSDEEEDEERIDAAMQELRSITGGKEMDESGRMQLYAQLRLLRLLSALPRGGDLSGEAKACIAAALSFERNLVQFRKQMENLEDWRRADPGLRARFDEYEGLETEPGGYRWGKHCSFCRHDRHRQIAMLKLCFCGRRQPVTFLEPILAQRGLLPSLACDASFEQATPMGCAASDCERRSGGSASSSSSGEDDEPLSVGYKRRQALHMQQGRQAERARRALQRQQQVGTPLRARRVAEQLAAAEVGSSDEDSLLGGAGIARHVQWRQRQVGQKRRHVSLLSSDEEEQQEEQQEQEQEGEGGPASSSDGSQQRQEGAAGQAGAEEEEWDQGTDPEDSDSSASEVGKRPRRRPRIGTDCWARAFVHRSIFRYPARLDAMLLYCTRRYLDSTPEAERPCSLPGLAHAVLQRYGRPLVKHYNQLMYSINGFNMLQNRKSDKSIANSMLVRELGELQYAHFTELSPEEQLWGVHIDAELAAFTATAAERRQRRVDAAVAQGADPATAAEADCGRLLLLRAAGRGGAAASSEEEEEGGDVQYEAEEQPEEDEGTEQRQRKRRRRTQQQQPRERLETPLFQRQSRRATAQRGGQRAAAAVAAAAAELGGLGDGAAAAYDDLATPSTVQRQQQRRQQQEEQEGTPLDRNACFYCGATGHWAAACPERQRCFHCKEIGHWSRDCPKLQRGSCYKCRQPGHWAANCPNC